MRLDVGHTEDEYSRSRVTIKRFKKFSLNFSVSLFVICVNLRHPVVGQSKSKYVTEPL